MSEIKYDKKRLNKVKSILVSQPQPKDNNAPFHRLAEKYGLKVDFIPFININPVSIKDFRKQKINILNHTAIIFTSRNAVDHFFRIAEGMNVSIPTDMKYFCKSEQTANYLQKYIVIRKRKIFIGERTIAELLAVMKETMNKFPDENYLFPCSNITRETISKWHYHYHLIKSRSWNRMIQNKLKHLKDFQIIIYPKYYHYYSLILEYL